MLAAATPFESRPSAGSELSDDTFRFWQARIQPTPEELAWRRVPWRTSLQTGLAEANAAGKPVLLWLMNGHPLGCT
jgi:hypothetical protein